jgi:hypothetical protein
MSLKYYSQRWERANNYSKLLGFLKDEKIDYLMEMKESENFKGGNNLNEPK